MVQDVYAASWEILESLNRYGSNIANQIVLHTKIGSRRTLYDALSILLEENLIVRDEKKVYSINTINYLNQSQIFRIFEQYQEVGDNINSMFSKLGERFKNHKPVFDPYSESDKNMIRELITKPPFYELISLIVRFYEIGSVMDFWLNSRLMSKTIEKRL